MIPAKDGNYRVENEGNLRAGNTQLMPGLQVLSDVPYLWGWVDHITMRASIGDCHVTFIRLPT